MHLDSLKQCIVAYAGEWVAGKRERNGGLQRNRIHDTALSHGHSRGIRRHYNARTTVEL